MIAWNHVQFVAMLATCTSACRPTAHDALSSSVGGRPSSDTPPMHRQEAGAVDASLSPEASEPTKTAHSSVFPPLGSWVAAEVTPTDWQLHASRALGRVYILATRDTQWLVDTPPDPPTHVYVVEGGVCKRESTLERGLPVVGALNLNNEPDRFFGVERVSAAHTVRNEHLGIRGIAGLGGVDRSTLWAVTTRHWRDYEITGVSEYRAWSGDRWRPVVATTHRGVTWPVAAESGDSLLVAERDVHDRGSDESLTTWRIRRPRGKRPIPLLAAGYDEGACARTRVTALYGFTNGELLATGATCQRRLLLERWPSGSATSVAQEIPDISTDKGGGGYYIDVVNSSLVRVRRKDGTPLTLSFDGSWIAANDGMPLRQDHILAQIREVSPATVIDEARVLSENVFVMGARKNYSFVLSDIEVVEPCHLVLPGR